MVRQAHPVSQSSLASHFCPPAIPPWLVPRPCAQEKGQFSGSSQSLLDASARCVRAKFNPMIRNIGRKMMVLCTREYLSFFGKKKKILFTSYLFNKASEGSEHHQFCGSHVLC